VISKVNPSTIAALRSQFQVFQRKIYLNSCSQGALSSRVEGAFLKYMHSWHLEGSPWDLWVDEYEQARNTFAAFIGAEANEVALVASASAGVNSVASALSFRERNKIVMGAFDFPTMGHIWLAQRPRGAEVTFVEPVDECIPSELYAAHIDANTLMVPLSHVCFMNGFRAPVAEITKVAHDRGALVLLDDYQDCGTRPVDVKAMGVDFYVSGTLKYLLGPPGLAFMYVRKSLIERLVPTVTGWFGQTNPFAFDVKLLDPARTARRFETGTPPIPSIYGAAEGVRLLQEVGMESVADHVNSLVRALLNGASDLGLVSKTPENSRGPLVVLRSTDADALVKRFAAKDLIVSNRHDGLRISFHGYNTLEDVYLVLELLEQNMDLLVKCGAENHVRA
jgi:selenocysteine lyase/cysteine desulfurase